MVTSAYNDYFQLKNIAFQNGSTYNPTSVGLTVLPFKSTLFAAFTAPDLRAELHVQPITLRYTAPDGEDPRFYGWWGDMEFGPHLLSVLAAPRQGGVEVIFHDPLKVSDYPDRKALGAACEAAVRSGLQQEALGQAS